MVLVILFFGLFQSYFLIGLIVFLSTERLTKIKCLWLDVITFHFQVAMRALGFEPKKEEIKKMIQDIDKDGTGMNSCHFSCQI